MLRARYLASLDTKSKGWRRLLSTSRNTERKPFCLVERNVVRSGVRRAVFDIEQAGGDVSSWDSEFMGLVEKVVGIGEEGIFRHLATFL